MKIFHPLLKSWACRRKNPHRVLSIKKQSAALLDFFIKCCTNITCILSLRPVLRAPFTSCSPRALPWARHSSSFAASSSSLLSLQAVFFARLRKTFPEKNKKLQNLFSYSNLKNPHRILSIKKQSALLHDFFIKCCTNTTCILSLRPVLRAPLTSYSPRALPWARHSSSYDATSRYLLQKSKQCFLLYKAKTSRLNPEN